MNKYKEFVQRLRKLTLEDEYLILVGDITPILRSYVRSINDVEFLDGSYHIYYGKVKNIIQCFIDFNVTTIDNVIKDADKFSNVLDRNAALCLMETTIKIHQGQQIDFGKEFLPVTSPVEKKIYDEVMEKYNAFLPKLYALRSKLELLDRPEKAKDFANEHFKISVKRTSEMFEFAQIYISLMLVDRTREITVSLEEIFLRLKNNLRSMAHQRDEVLRNLLHKLYEKNKQYFIVCRQSHKNSVELVEISHSVNLIRDKIESTRFDASLARLEEEVTYWRDKVDNFHHINATVDKLKLELKEVSKQIEIYNSLECKDLPGQKQEQWEQIGKNCRKMRRILKEKMIEIGKVIITFFAIRGADRIIRRDSVGLFYLDEYNHKIYQFDYGMKQYHLTCEGIFKESSDNKKYFHDEHGRYILEDNEKFYQLAPCTSLYKLGDDGILNKVTNDCGHSMSVRDKCKWNTKDQTDVVILPNTKSKDIQSTLKPEVVKYLWGSLGHILPDALCDTGRDRTNNPIQYLAHKILTHKYSRSLSEQLDKKKEAEAYSAEIYKERKEKVLAASKAWKAKQVKRRKPEESDNAEDSVLYHAQIATQQFIKDLNYYDN